MRWGKGFSPLRGDVRTHDGAILVKRCQGRVLVIPDQAGAADYFGTENGCWLTVDSGVAHAVRVAKDQLRETRVLGIVPEPA